MRTSFQRKKDFLVIAADTDTLLTQDGSAMSEDAARTLDSISQVADIVVFAKQGLNTKLFMPLCGKIAFLHMQQTLDKSVCVNRLLTHEYIKAHVLIVGAQNEDAQAAKKTGTLYYSTDCGWGRLLEEALPKLLHGTYKGAYNNTMLNREK